MDALTLDTCLPRTRARSSVLRRPYDRLVAGWPFGRALRCLRTWRDNQMVTDCPCISHYWLTSDWPRFLWVGIYPLSWSVYIPFAFATWACGSQGLYLFRVRLSQQSRPGHFWVREISAPFAASIGALTMKRKRPSGPCVPGVTAPTFSGERIGRRALQCLCAVTR